MAVSWDPSNEVLRAFSHFHKTEMTLIELHGHLSTRVHGITTDTVLQIVRLPNLVNLFNLQPISNELCLIQLNPKLTLCEACLQTHCPNKGNCTKLHLCRYASHFPNKPTEKPCHFPHKLNETQNNLTLLRRFGYETLDEDRLLDLLRLHYSQSQVGHQTPSRPSPHHRFPSTNTPNKCSPKPPSQSKKSSIPHENTLDRQLDFSIPSIQDAPDVDLEIIQLLLATKNLIVERILAEQISNEYYRRFTLQFSTPQMIEQVLGNEPIIIYHNIPIKMKRTQRRRDAKMFVLKFPTAEKIDSVKLNLYVKTLVGKKNSNVLDMTPDGNDEQIHFIRCEEAVDFSHLYKAHSAKMTLQGHRVLVNEVYEAQIIEISFVHGSVRSPMTIPRLRQLFGDRRWQEDVFACLSICDQNRAEIELMNAEITAKWLTEASRFERELSLEIHPMIDFIQSTETNNEEDDDELTRLLSTAKISPNELQKGENERYNYYFKVNWRIVLTHPVFGEEYRQYIREHLNISIQITGPSIEVPSEKLRKELARYTNMFIQNFVFREVSNLEKGEVKRVKENYSRMAHKWLKDTNKTLIAARRDVMNELFPPLTSTTSSQSRTVPAPRFRPQQSPIMKKQEQLSTPSPPVREESTEANVHSLSYSIENTVYLPFFSASNVFSDRLRMYLYDTFNVKLMIKSTSSTKVVLELSGQYKDVSDGRSALTALLSGLKTKSYTDAQNFCKFSVPDVYRVAQWNLDRCSIVSSCSFSTKSGGLLSVRYFADNPHCGVDEKQLDEILSRCLYDASYRVSISSPKLRDKLQKFEQEIQHRPDYGQAICCIYRNHQRELPSLDLCGTKSIVQQLYHEVKTIGDECMPIPCSIQLQANEAQYLLEIRDNDLKQLEEKYKNDGVDLRSRLKSEPSEFLAPKYLHEKMKLLLMDMSRTQTISKDLKCSPRLTNPKKEESNTLPMKNHCLIASRASGSASAYSSPTTVTIGLGSIHLSNGDLSTESADVLVVCSTSMQLRIMMIKLAGTQVEKELTGKDLSEKIVDTSAGQLKQAKRLFFLPWTPPATYFTHQDIKSLQQSIATFITHAIRYTIDKQFTSIAFPAIGCGGFGIQPEVIATLMIDAACEHITRNPSVPLKVTFVVQQAQVSDAFQAKLKSLSTVSRTRSPSPRGSAN